MPADEPDEPTGAVRGRRSPGRHRTDRPTAAPRTPEVGFPAVHRPGQRPPDRPRHARGGDRYAAHGGSDGGTSGAARDDAARDDSAWDAGWDTGSDAGWDDSAWGGEGRDQLWDERPRDAPPRGGTGDPHGDPHGDPYGAEPTADEPQPAAPGWPAARLAARSADPYGADPGGPLAGRTESSRAGPFGAAPQRSTPRRADPDDAASEDASSDDASGGRADGIYAAPPHDAVPPPGGSAAVPAVPDPYADHAEEVHAGAPDRIRSDVPRSARPADHDGYAPDPYGEEPPPGRPGSWQGAARGHADPSGPGAGEAYGTGPTRDRSGPADDLFGAEPSRSDPRGADHADDRYAAHPDDVEPVPAAPPPGRTGRSAGRATAPGRYADPPDAEEGYGPHPADDRHEPHGDLFGTEPSRSAPRATAARRYADQPDADEAYEPHPAHDRHDPPEDLVRAEPPRSAGRATAPRRYADQPDADEAYGPHPADDRRGPHGEPFGAEPARSAPRASAPGRYADPPDADEGYGPQHEPPEDLFGTEPARSAAGGPDHADPQPAPPGRSASRGTPPRRYADAPDADEAYSPYRDRPDVPHADLFGAQPPHRAAPGDPANGGYPPPPYGAVPQPASPGADHGDDRAGVAPADGRAPATENGPVPPRRSSRGRAERPAEPVLPAMPDRRPGDPPSAPAELFVETTAETPALTPELLSRHADSLEWSARADEPGPARGPARESAERRRVLGVPLPALPGWAARLLPGARAADGSDPGHGTGSEHGHGDEHGHGHGHGPARPAGRRVRILIAALLVPCALATLAGLALLWPTGGPPATAQPGGQDLVHGQVTATRVADCSGGSGSGGCIALVVHMADGPRADRDLVQMVPIEPSTPEFVVGDQVVLAWSGADPDEPGSYQVVDFQRDVPLAWLAGLFAAAVLVLGRWRGLAALAALGLSFVVLLFFVVPAILAGRDPLAVAVVGACLIMFAVLYLTHGPSARTSTAVLGTLLSLALIGALGAGFSAAADLTGLDDQTTNLIATLGTGVDARGLLLAGVVIGALGVLDDVTVTQTSAVWELRYANPTLGARQLFTSAMRIGRDHVASAVNTLVLAYAGAALPLLLLFSLSGRGFGDVVTSQEVATEIVRTLVGSIGLVASVPITTALAAAVASREAVQPADA